MAFKKYKLNEDVTLQIISYTEEMMVVKLWFTGAGFKGTHHHVNQEINTVISGKFKAINGSETNILNAGEAVHIHPDIQHNLECLTPTGEIITCWTPARKDIIENFSGIEN